MSILETTANYTVTVPSSPPVEDPFELVQGAHFMQILLAQLRPRSLHNRRKSREMLEQLAQMNLLQEIDSKS